MSPQPDLIKRVMEVVYSFCRLLTAKGHAKPIPLSLSLVSISIVCVETLLMAVVYSIRYIYH